MLIGFELTGKTPILFHADDVELSDELKLWRDDPDNDGVSVAGDDRSPPWTWQTYLYTDGKELVIPTDNLMACLRKAGAAIVIPGGKNGKTFKEATQSALYPAGEYLEFFSGGNKIPMAPILKMRELLFKEQCDRVRKLGASLFMKRAKIGQSKHVRVRLRVEDWCAAGSLNLDNVSAPELTFEILGRIFAIAGSRVGLLDWRPASPKSPGPYGTFEAKLTVLEK